MTVSQANAVPTLQIDIVGGSYDQVTETVISSAANATIVALLTPKEDSAPSALLDETFYLSIAAQTANGGSVSVSDLTGTQLVIDGMSYDASQFTFGTPPSLATDNPILGSHDVFDTAFLEIPFMFSAESQTATYNSEDAPGAETLFDGGTGSYFRAFDLSTSSLANGINLHFDLYKTTERMGEVVLDMFAPFSHDAELVSNTLNENNEETIPEPGSTIIFVLAVLAIARTRISL